MYSRQPRTLGLLLLAVCCLYLAAPTIAVADDIVPWMTGYFSGHWPYEMSALSPDSQWSFSLSGAPTEYVNWSWECGENNYYCEHKGFGYFTGGSVGGTLYQWNGSDWILQQTFNGLVAPGGYIENSEVYLAGQLTYWWYQYQGLRFQGFWSNGWTTEGEVSGYQASNGSEGANFDVTTSTPEPGTIVMMTNGALVCAGFIRRKLR